MKRRLLPLLAAPLCAVALAAPAAAAAGPAARTAGPSALPVPAAWGKWSPPASPKAAPSAMAGFFNSGDTTPGNGYSYNSTGGAVTSTSTSTGVYAVDFAGLGGITGGNVEVSTEDTLTTCTVVEWSPFTNPNTNTSDLGVSVNCYDYSGNPVTANFSLAVTQPTHAPHGALAYDWNYRPTSSYTPTGGYQYNSARKRNHITHLGKGRYEVTMPKVGASGQTGTVKVSAYGAGGGDCQLAKWNGTRSHTEQIWVDCFSATGARQNREFDVIYARSTNLLGQNGLTGASALANRPGVSTYLPSSQWSSRRGAKVNVTEFQRPDIYEVQFAGIGAVSSDPNGEAGNVQVTAEGNSYLHCLGPEWGPGFTAVALVGCVNNADHLVKASYTIQWISR